MADKGLVWFTNADQSDLDSGDVRFVNGFKGEPKATDTCSTAQLSKMGMVGIYRREGDTEFRAVRHKHRDRRDVSGPQQPDLSPHPRRSLKADMMRRPRHS